MRIIDRIHQVLLDANVPERSIRRELAQTCGISVQAVGEWYTKNNRISPDYLAKIAKRWKTTTDYLITGKHPRGTGDPELDSLVMKAVLEDAEALKAILRAYVKETPE